MNTEIKNIWKALANLDKAEILTTALSHAIVAMLIDKGIGSQEEIAKEMEKSISEVMANRTVIRDALSDPQTVLNDALEKETMQ